MGIDDGAVPPARRGAGPALIRWALPAGFAALAAAYLAWGWSDQITDFGGDSAAYMLQARLLSPFTDHSAAYSTAHSTVLAEAVRATPFPPLFPLLVGLLGAGFLAGHLVVVTALLAALLCLNRWLRQEGMGIGASAAVTLVFALMPGTYFPALNIMSENPYLALSLLCILAERRAAAAGRDAGSRWWLAVGLAAAATLVRTAALPLLLALALRLLLLRPRGWFLMILGSALPAAAWFAWSAFDRGGISVYAEQASPLYRGELPARLIAQLRAELPAMLIGWVEDWLGEGRSNALSAVAVLAGAVCLGGWLRRLAALRFDAIYVGLYLALLAVWPFPDAAQRLEYVIVPVLLAQGGLLLHSLVLARRGPASRLAGALVLGLAALPLLPTLALTVSRFAAPVPEGMALARHTPGWYRVLDQRTGVQSVRFLTMILDDLPQAASRVPPGECIFSEKPTIVSLYSGRMSYFPPPYGSADEQFRSWIGRCRYAYVLALTSPSFPEPLYPLQRLRDRVTPLSVVKPQDGSYPIPFAELLQIHD